ncbi:MAG: site-2 protease family protein, partial [Actinomycetaceae bacterium]|nr:site-2 protease family protein [Actinomycetaceae bacterium]
MSFLIGVIILIIGLLISVALHELGHLFPAKRFGVKVPQYFVGFGPTIWSKQVGETEYGIKAIPLGGFVRLASMLYPGSPNRKQTRKSGQLTWAEEARRASAEELGEGEENRAFWKLSAWKKFVVMFSGPLVNLALSVVFMSIVLVGIGQVVPSNTISHVEECVASENECTDADPASPAARAGLQAGDTIVEW